MWWWFVVIIKIMTTTQSFTRLCFPYTAKLFVMSIAGAVFFIISAQTAAAQTPTVGSFSTTWQTDNPGSSATNQITIPTRGGSTYNYDIYWEDVNDVTSNGTVNGNTGAATITFPSIGTYRVDITGTFPRIFFNNTGDRRKILTIEQWGTIEWTSMENAFDGASNLTYNATDAPDLSNVTSLEMMFLRATAFNGNLDNWDLTNVTNTSSMFFQATNFNGTLNGWGTTTANISNMSYMFEEADSFNQPLDTWDLSGARDIRLMFFGADDFNSALNGWGTTTAGVTNMFGMFSGTRSFNQPLDAWDVSGVTDLTNMFRDAGGFNGALNGWGTTTASVRNMSGMFQNATSFNQPLDTWDVSGVTNMSEMFQGATDFDSALNGWGTTTQNVTRLFSMFDGASSFNQPLDAWDVTLVTDMALMFQGATNFNSALNGWGATTASVNSTRAMFEEATNFNQPLDAWNVSGMTDMSSMFKNASDFNRPLNNWGASTANLINMGSMFEGASSFNQPLGAWDIRSLQSTGLNDAFNNTAWNRENYSSTLQGWNTQSNTPNDMTLVTTSEYLSTVASDRSSLIANNNWTITDGGIAAVPASRSGGGSGTRICNPENDRNKNCRESRTEPTEIDSAKLLTEREQLLARIAQLQQLLAELQAQAGLSNLPTIANLPSLTICNFTRDLTIGATGDDVRCLQEFLTTTSDYTFVEGPTGFFGLVTEQAVKSWQTRAGVFPATGYFGPISREVITK